MAQKEKGTEDSRTDVLHRLVHFPDVAHTSSSPRFFFFSSFAYGSLLIALRFLLQGVEPGGKDFAALVHLL